MEASEASEPIRRSSTRLLTVWASSRVGPLTATQTASPVPSYSTLSSPRVLTDARAVFQLSAQFPGPTSPRDFVTLLLTSDRKSQADSVRREGTRQYIIVSKPCKHPDCPPREGIIRGQYESVEMIREIPVDAGASSKASLSTADLPGRDEDGQTDARPPLKAQDRENLLSDRMPPKACLVEWNMITRSEPGGSVPRFMVEKGTPPGIVSDAGKFLKWLRSECAQGHTDSDRVGDAPGSAETQSHTQPGRQERNGQEVGDANGEQDPGFTGHIGILDAIMGAVGASTSVASDPRRNLDDTREMQPEAHDDKNSTSSASDSSDARSFASALDGDNFLENVNNSVAESRSDDSSKAPSYHAAYAKELKKLEERRRKLDAKADRIQKRLEQKRLEDEQKDATAKAKVREKNEKELAKQEAKYKRELKKIEEKREAEERKAEQKRLKAVERDEKAKLLMDLDRMKVERELALKRVEALEAQIGDLKAQNTDLVAKLDKMRLGDASAPPEKTSGSGGPEA